MNTPNPPATDRVAAKSAAKARAVQMFQYIVMPMSHQAMINYFAEQLEAHARYFPGGEEPGWISVETELPNKSDEFLVVESDGVVMAADFRVELEDIRKSSWWTVRSFGIDCEERELYDVKMWREFPAPPQPSGEDK